MIRDIEADSELSELRILSPTAILGYGFPEASFRRGLERRPHAIAVDAGSTDPGPYYLGSGISFTDRSAVRRDLKLILEAGRELNIPVIIGSAGGAGAKPHLEWTLEIVREIASASGLRGSLAIINADIDRERVLSAFRENGITPLTPGQALSENDITESSQIVAQMGEEPLIAALQDGADVILAGRSYDPAVFAALPISLGFDRGLALHMGKILECAAIAASPGSGSDCMLGTLYRDAFVVEPLSDDRVCTIASVAGHSLYEKSNPYVLPGPGGSLDLTNTAFEQIDERRVRVSGSMFIPAKSYFVKLEAARRMGFRTISIAGARDPAFIVGFDKIVEGVRKRTAENFREIDQSSYTIRFIVYGRDGVMGDLEPDRTEISHEIGIVIDVTAASQELADTLCAFTRSTLLHFGYPGRMSTGGNLALPYSPSDFQAGEVYEFSLYHLMAVEDPGNAFLRKMARLEER
ncbi:acyclic terpene utilization AtuA family protein [Hoeflea alexandrii]|uniref:acyclic terpene utilization AtuA family protein n=1 Tax=Hoeflea alexandrii TaxID=288436 RepID=UPI0022B06842|nr:acyclic terpene utilization AtuA family protein [Hoeflea alexandrii]MCZ4291518.1 acyclic terpene utilization AtuA family protein [Hoeflea alexandrii]